MNKINSGLFAIKKMSEFVVLKLLYYFFTILYYTLIYYPHIQSHTSRRYLSVFCHKARNLNEIVESSIIAIKVMFNLGLNFVDSKLTNHDCVWYLV